MTGHKTEVQNLNGHSSAKLRRATRHPYTGGYSGPNGMLFMFHAATGAQ